MSDDNMVERTEDSGAVVAGEIRVRRGAVGDLSGEKVGVVRSTTHDVQGEEVRLMQSAARSVRAAEVSATLSTALQVEAQTAEMRFGAVGLLEADYVEIGPGSVYAAIGQDVNLKSCVARMALAQGSIQAERSLVGVAAAREIEANEVRTGFLIAREVRGTVRALLDTRAAAVFGAAFGAAFAAVWLMRRRED